MRSVVAISRRKLCAGAVASLASTFSPSSVIAREGRSSQEKFSVTESNIRRLITDHIRLASPHEVHKRTCSDDRVEEDDGATAVFGADGGALADMLVLIRELNDQGIRIAQKDAIDAFFETVGGSPRFCYHTDEETDGKDGRGCAHCRLVQEQSKRYGLTPELADLFRQTLLNVEARPDVLKGKHEPVMLLSLYQTSAIKLDGSGALILDHRMHVDGQQVQAFVYRPDLMWRQINSLAGTLMRYSSTLRSLGMTEDMIAGRLWNIQRHSFAVTAGEIASKIPHVIARVDSDLVCRMVRIT
ncbi:hypothetical protein HZC00_02875 [Candidatus Kaiserbacteria bacterium]|nr:hypothetical protein [Candidatus Kaiserbacteria bacterium]